MVKAKTKIRKKKKDKNRTRNIIILVVVVIVTIVGGVYAAKNSNGGGKTKLKVYQETEEVTIGEINISVKATGNLEPWEKIDLKPEASGKVIKLLVDEGDIIQEGQVVAILDQTSQEYALESAKASVLLAKASLDETRKGYRDIEKASLEDSILRSKVRLADAQREFDIVKELLAKGISPRNEYDSAKAFLEQVELEVEGLEERLEILLSGGEKEALDRARASYSIARSNLKDAERLLGDASVDAPMSGIVLQKYVSEGSVILSGLSTFSSGEALISIGDVSRMKLIAQVDEGDISDVKIGQKTLIEVDAYPDDKFEGSVTKIAPQGSSMESVMTTFGVTIEIDNSDSRLKSGFTADVEIVVDEIASAIRIPFRAVLETEEKFYCFVVDDDENIEEREIELGKTNYEYYEVLSGLDEGEKVITKGRPSKLKDEKEKMEQSTVHIKVD